jgi:RNA polymerase sigma-70 factor (ECF subfamily)
MTRQAGRADPRSSAEPSRPGELDRRTLDRCRAKDPIAFRALVVRYERAVFALLSRMLGRGPHVQDLAQDTFLRAYEALPRFDPEGPARLSTWLLTIATRLALDWAKRRDVDPPLVMPPAAPTPETLGARRELARAIERAAQGLTVEQRAVFLLADLHELSVPEIALAVGVAEGTVKSRLSRAREHMRAALLPLRK